MRQLFNLFRSRRVASARQVSKRTRQFNLEVLEDRNVPSTVSAITANFSSTAIPAGDTVWFSSSFQASGLPATAPVTLHVENETIDFSANGHAYHVPVPNGVIVLNPGATSSSVTFDSTDNDWDVSAPASGAGDIFMSGVKLPVPAGLPGNIQNVTWTADFWCDTAGVSVTWKWAASVYTSFSTNYNALAVKPVDSSSLSAYHNLDQAGSPEAYKSSVISGARGIGGTSYTGADGTSKTLKPSLGDGLQDYPYPSSNPLTNVAFNESAVLRGANLDAAKGYFELWYSDEHALALGIRQVNVKTASGTTTTNYPLTAMTSNPAVSTNPAVGTNATTGNQAGTDVSGRPMTPTLYITDITSNPNNRSGDWQWGGKGYSPNGVFGTWKAFTRTVDTTTSTPTISVTADADPVKNNWNLGSGSDAAPAGLANEGYGAEVRWNLDDMYKAGVLLPGHTYRFYVIVHDGDQNKVGGDSGQASFNYSYPGPSTGPIPQPSLSGFVYADPNNNGIKETGEFGIATILVTLKGTDNLGNTVTRSVRTDSTGAYHFTGLAAGTYTVSHESVSQYINGKSSVGTVKGVTDGKVLLDGSLSQIVLKLGDIGLNYNFGELNAGS